MGKIGQCRSTFGMLSDTQKLIDLPASGGTPAEIDLSDNISVAVAIWVDEDIIYTYATDATEAGTRFTAKNCTKVPAGFVQIPVVGNSKNLYIRRYDGSAVGDGLSYQIIEGD
jgi:hypothetical protein